MDSPDLPALFAGGSTFEEAQQLARQIVRDELGARVALSEQVPRPAQTVKD